MGLCISHGCLRMSYSGFHHFRCAVAELANIPLPLMEGFYEPDETDLPSSLKQYFPLRWDTLKPDVLHVFLSHSDCDGDIPWDKCVLLADRLDELVTLIPGAKAAHHRGGASRELRSLMLQLSEGLRQAHARKEDVTFD